MAKKYFGTDGIRDRALAGSLELGRVVGYGVAIALELLEGRETPRVALAMDTRASCDTIATAISAGLLSQGVDLDWVGVLPTTGLAIVTAAGDYSRGIVISASHNPAADNGIKIFGPEGTKLSDEHELEIERIFDDEVFGKVRPAAPVPGKFVRREELAEVYLNFLEKRFRGKIALPDDFCAVLDCAHGATYRVAPEIMRRLGIRVKSYYDAPDGENINRDCGALHPEVVAHLTKQHGAAVGFTFDGDGDRVLLADSDGNVRDGDYMLAFSALFLKERNALPGNTVVSTVMANLGLELALGAIGARLERTAVGDKYVTQCMQKNGYVVGGEQSGHIIFAEDFASGDGLLTALKMLEIVSATKKSVAGLSSVMRKYPQTLVNVRVRERVDIDNVPELKSAREKLESGMGSGGRLVLRYSGTEPLLRIMIEGADQREIEKLANDFAATVRKAIGE